jgi:hypothetical protein
MAIGVEVLGLEKLLDPIESVGREQHGAQHGSFGVEVAGRDTTADRTELDGLGRAGSTG